MGPLYCETGNPWLFMAEPINTITNAAIVFAAACAFWYVRKHAGRFSLEQSALIFLLFATGVGSFLWHALRTEWALTMDFVPGVLFLLVFTFAWGRRFFGLWSGVAGMAVLAGISWSSGFVAQAFALPFLVPLFAGTLIVGLVFVYATKRVANASLAHYAFWMLMVALAAAVFRTVDLYTCSYLPSGTHFLWHLCLSLAAYMGIVLLVRMDALRA